MTNRVGRLVSLPFRLVADGIAIAWIIIGFLRPAQKPQRNQAHTIERQRRELNRRTFDALNRKLDETQRVPHQHLKELYDLRREHIVIEQEIEILLADRSIREEQGLRAGATSVLLQLSLLLRLSELRCGELAIIDYSDGEFEEVLRVVDGDLEQARACYTTTIRRYLRPLRGHAMRRERVARRLLWILTLGREGALDQDAGANDISLELHGLESMSRELRSVSRLLSSEYLRSKLETAAIDYAEIDDARLVGELSEIVEKVVRYRASPADENYPLLVLRMQAIRARFNNLPGWWWSMHWRVYCAILQSWLYLFASRGARGTDKKLARKLLQQAVAMREQASTLLAKADTLARGMNPLFTSVGMLGRQKEIPGFGQPPDRRRLMELLDELGIRLNAPHTKPKKS